MLLITDPVIAARVAGRLHCAPVSQRVYRDRAGRVAVEVTHTDQSRTGRTTLLPDVPVHVDAALLIERREARLVDEALERR